MKKWMIKTAENVIVYTTAAIFFSMLLMIMWCDEKFEQWKGSE